MGIPKVRKGIDKLKPYEMITTQPQAFNAGIKEALKIDWNESTRPVPSFIKEAIIKFITEKDRLHWYPELFSVSLSKKIAVYNEVSPDKILVTNGSDDALDLILKVFLNPDEGVFVPAPSYSHFLIFARSNLGTVVNPLAPDPFSVDLSWLEKEISNNNVKVAYLVSPNNPTGIIYKKEIVESLASKFEDKVFIIDEAYYEFSGETAKEVTEKFENVLITRTFSKAFGLAGLRCGYIIANPSLISVLKKVLSPKSVNVIAQVAAEAAVSNPSYMYEFVKEVKKSMKILENFFAEKGYEVKTTPANFIMIKVSNPDETIKKLAHRNIFARNRSHMPGLQGFIRFSVPDTHQTKILIEKIKDLF